MLKELQELFDDPLFDQNESKKDRIEFKEGDIREVAVLFADLAGFTALCEKISQEETQLLLDKILSAFTQVIQKNKGEVSRYVGDQVMALFGAKLKDERDLEHALKASLEIVQTLDHINALLKKSGLIDRLGDPLRVRIGLNYGEVATGKVGANDEIAFTVYGETVNSAARIESHAPLNKVMLPTGIAEQVDSRFVFKPAGEFYFKGISKPLECSTLESISEYVAEPIEKQEFVGRRDLLESLKTYQENTAVQSHWVHVWGPAGIGKSRFVKEFVNTLDENVLVFRGFCSELPLSHFSGARSLVKQMVEGSSVSLDSILEEKDFDIGKINSINFDSFREVVLDVAESSLKNKSPIVIILEDFHWADGDTKKVLSILFQLIKTNTMDLNVLVIVTSRLSETPFKSSFTKFLEVPPLCLTEIEEISDIVHAKKLFEKTGGNPLFIEELVNLGSVDDDLPSGIRNVIMAKFDRLNKKQKMVLNILAILGNRFPRDLSKSVLNKIVGGDYLLENDQGISYFIQNEEENNIGLRHDLIRETIYQSILEQNRKPVHLTVAQELESYLSEENSDRNFLLGHHYYCAGELQTAQLYMDRAAFLAVKNNDYIKAKGLYLKILSNEKIVKNYMPPRYIWNLRINLSDAVKAMGDLPYCVKLLDEAWKLLMEEENRVGKKSLVCRARILNRKGFVSYSLGELEEAESYSRRALEIFKSIGDQIGVAWCYISLSNCQYVRGRFQKASKLLDLALENCDDSRPNAEFGVRLKYAYIHMNNGKIAEASESIETARKIMLKKPLIHFQARLKLIESRFFFYRAKYLESIESSQDAIEFAEETGEQSLICDSLIREAYALWETDPNEAFLKCERALKIAKEIESQWYQALAHRHLGNSARYLKKYIDAESHFVKSLQFYKKVGAKFHEHQTRMDACDLYLEMKNRKIEALDQIEICFDLCEKMDGVHIKLKCRLHCAKFHYIYGDFENALSNLESIFTHRLKEDMPFIYFSAICLGSRCLINLGKIKEAKLLFSKLDRSQIKNSVRAGELGFLVQTTSFLISSHTKDIENFEDSKKSLIVNLEKCTSEARIVELLAVLTEGCLVTEDNDWKKYSSKLFSRYPRKEFVDVDGFNSVTEGVKERLVEKCLEMGFDPENQKKVA